MEPRTKQLSRPLALVLAVAFILSACKLYIPDGDSDGDEDVSFFIQQTPHQGQFGAGLTIGGVELAIEAVELERADGDVVDVTVSAGDAFELMPPDEVEDPRILQVFTDQSLPDGEYSRLTLVLDTDASFVLPVGSSPVPLAAEDGAERLEFESSFSLDGATELVLTVDLHAGLLEDNGGFELRPAHFITREATSGLLRVRQRPSCPELGLYFYQGRDQDPAELGDSGAPDFSLRPELGRSDVFLPYFPSGEYTVWYTCEAHQDSPDSGDGIEFEASENLEVEDGRCSQLEFGGGPGEPGTC